jgi:hypothetical protein
MSHCNEKKNSLWTNVLKLLNYYHGEEKGYNNLDKYNYDIFLKNYTFWKFFLIFFFLLLIGIINLINNKKSLNYIRENPFLFILELLLLFFAFFISRIFMYYIRGEEKLLTSTNIISAANSIFILVLFKHISFELSGLYKLKFGDKNCKKEHYKINKEDECKCNNGIFTSPFWDGVGKYGIGFTIILILYFLISLLYDLLKLRLLNVKWIFNFKFSWYLSLICLVIIIGTLFFGAYIDKIFNLDNVFNECKKETLFERIKNGCGLVCIVFIIIITLLLPIILIKWLYYKRAFDTDKALNSKNSKILSNYNCKSNIRKGGYSRLSIIIIESIFSYLILMLVDAIIEAIRIDEKIVDILRSTIFWKNSIPTLFGILYIQIILEYSNWFENHLFKKKEKKICKIK